MSEVDPGAASRRPTSVYGHGVDPDVRFSLANERTYLAWVRTGLALVAGAVAVHSPYLGLAGWEESALSAFLLALAATCVAQGWWRWQRTERAMRTGSPLPGFLGGAAFGLGVGLLILGVAISTALAR